MGQQYLKYNQLKIKQSLWSMKTFKSRSTSSKQSPWNWSL